MTVLSIDFSNLDLAYVINYQDNSDMKMLGSNDPAMDSMKDAKIILTEAVKNYAEVSDAFYVALKKVVWGKDKVAIKFSFSKKEGWPKRVINCHTSTSYAGKRETDIDPRRLEILEDTDVLRKEVEKYLMGQRMQKELPFQE